MNRTYKVIASNGNEIVFDDRLEATTPRNARRELKKKLGVESLSGIVYSITEIPVELIRQIVDARIAEIVGGAPLNVAPPTLESVIEDRLRPLMHRLTALEGRQPTTTQAPRPPRFDPLADLGTNGTCPEIVPDVPAPEPPADPPPPPDPPGPDLSAVRRHYRRYRNPALTAQKFGLTPRMLKTCARVGGWDA
jgi:hypothetical protein